MANDLLNVLGAGNTDSSRASVQSNKSSNSDFDLDSFYKLLAAQLSNQDMNSEADSASSYIDQMLQIATMQTMNSLTEVSTAQMQLQSSGYATGLMGKEVTVMEVDKNGQSTNKTTVGTVTGVSLYGTPLIYIDKKPYYLSQLMEIGETGSKDEDPDKPPVDGGGGVDGDKPPVDGGGGVDGDKPSDDTGDEAGKTDTGMAG